MSDFPKIAGTGTPAQERERIVALAKEMFLAGTSYKDISAALNVKPALLRIWAYRRRWIRPAPSAPMNPPPLDSIPEPGEEPEPITSAPQRPTTPIPQPKQPKPPVQRRPPPSFTRKDIEEAALSSPKAQAGLLATLSESTRNNLALTVTRQAQLLAETEVTSLGQLRNTRFGQGLAEITRTIVTTASTLFDWSSQKQPGVVMIGEVERLEVNTPTVTILRSGGVALAREASSANTIDVQAEASPVPALSDQAPGDGAA